MLLLISGNLVDIDPRVDKVYYNPIAIRPAASASRGQIVLFEDKGRSSYYSDGNNWIPLNGSFAGGTRSSTGSETLSVADNYKTIVNDSTTASSYTVLNDTIVPWEDDTFLNLFQKGTGKPNFVAGAGVTIRVATNVPEMQQYAHRGLHKVGANEWAVV